MSVEFKGYVTNLGKYNEGELIGKWVNFPVDEDEWRNVMKEIGCAYEDDDGEIRNPMYEEYFFTDWECEIEIPATSLDEFMSYEDVNEIAEKLEAWDQDTLEAACEIWGFKEVIDQNPDNFSLRTDIETDYDLGYYYAIELNCIDFGNNETLERYFDFESYGRDIRFEADGGFATNGWIEYWG